MGWAPKWNFPSMTDTSPSFRDDEYSTSMRWCFYSSFSNDFLKVIAWMCNLRQKKFSDTRQKNQWLNWEDPWTFIQISQPFCHSSTVVLCHLLLCCNRETNEVKRRDVYINQCANIGATLFTYRLVQFISFFFFMLEWFVPVFQHRWGWISSIRARVGSS